MRPSLGLVVSLGGGLALGAVLAMFWPELASWWGLAALVALPALIDLGWSLSLTTPSMTRSVVQPLIQGRRVPVTLKFDFSPIRRHRVVVFDGIPPSFESADLPWRADRSLSGPGVSIQYMVEATRRGIYRFEPAWLDERSPWGLWIRRHRVGPVQEVRVFPDLRRLVGDSVFLGKGTVDGGRHAVRRRGQGLEFHQMREYRQGDMARMIDGKASSRLNRLVVREMQEEQDQTILFLLDTGYRMTDGDGRDRHFDLVFEAMLSLADVALRQGDRVGVRTWGPDERWIPPVRGRTSFSVLVQKLFDVEARPEASSLVAALHDLLPRLTRRTLVILLTNFREEDRESIAPLASLYRNRHLLCSVWLREEVVDHLKTRTPTTLDEALETAMAVAYSTERTKGKRLSEGLGLLTLDVTPQDLRGDLIQKYWEIKKRGLL